MSTMNRRYGFFFEEAMKYKLPKIKNVQEKHPCEGNIPSCIMWKSMIYTVFIYGLVLLG